MLRAPCAIILIAWTSAISCRATVSLAQGSKADLLARIALDERVQALDPNDVWALRDAAINLGFLVLNAFSSNRDADLARATNFANRALQLAPNDAEV